MVKDWTRLCLGVGLMFAVAGAQAQAYPDRPVRLIVPFAAGGTTDFVARTIAPRLSELLGQPLVIENKGGGGTVIGTEVVARAPADGYTILLATPDLTVNASLRTDLPYDTKTGFSPIGLIGSYPMALVVNAHDGFGSVADIVNRARQKPGAINVASGGIGSMPHLSAELFQMLSSTELSHVPYKGNAPAVTDLIAGHVSMLFSGLPTVEGYVKEGRLKVLAVTGRQRHAALPEVPTVEEGGVKGFEVISWFGLLGPKGLPEPVVARLNAALKDTLDTPAIRERMAPLGADLSTGTPAAFGALIRKEVALWADVVKTSGVKVQ